MPKSSLILARPGRIGAIVLALCFGTGMVSAQAPSSAAPAIAPAIAPLSEAIARDAQALSDRALADHYAYDLVSDLTTRIGPRQAGSPDEARARDWALDQLSRMGFKNVHVEPFDVPFWRRGAIELDLLAPHRQKLVATALGFSPGTPAEGIEGDIVYFDTLADLRAAAPGSLSGKIAFVNQLTARAQDGSGYGFSVALRSRGAAEAAKRGARALLIRSIGTDSHRLPHTGAQSRDDGPPPIPAAALAAPDANLLQRLMTTTRQPLRVRLKLDAENLGMQKSGNVIAELPGREKPDEIVLIGAHLDSWDQGEGAIDDGAGVAIVTAAAKTLADMFPHGAKRTIRLVLFGSEEIGIFGGQAYAKAHAGELAKHVIAAESDFGAGRIWRYETHVRDEALPRTRAIGQILARLAIAPGDNQSTDGPDLGPMLRAGVPVVGLSQDGVDYFDTHHTPDDVLERIDPKTLPQQVAAYALVAYLAAETDGEPFGPAAPVERPAR